MNADRNRVIRTGSARQSSGSVQFRLDKRYPASRGVDLTHLGDKVKIKVLGPLTAEIAGRSIVPSAAKPRQILALLAVNANHVVPASTLMEEIWGSRLPRSSTTTLQTYILLLRRMLGAAGDGEGLGAAKRLLVTQYGGYRLVVEPDAVDLHHYDRLVAEGRAAFDAFDNALAGKTLREALAVWEGQALVDVRTGPVLGIELARLEESRLSTLELRIETALRAGRHTALLAELAELTARHPLHEGLHAQRMAALYRSGRSWQALQVFQKLRANLIEELGIEPSPRMQQLHQAVLGSDPALDAAPSQKQVLNLFAA